MLLTLLPAYGVFLLAVMSPGPDFLIALQTSVRHGARAGIWAALGIALANLVHIAYVHIGLGALIAHSLVAFTVLKFFAAGYLIYLGIRGLRSRPATGETPLPPEALFRQRGAFARGFITNALNPKAAIFWLSFLTIVVDPTMPPGLLAGFVALLILTVFAWFSAVAWFMSRPLVRQKFLRAGHWFDRAAGAVLVALGLKVALTAR